MAKAVTDEQMLLRRRARRRLIGAVALVTLIALVLPWILESEPGPSEQAISIQIPSPDSGTFTSRVATGKAQEPPKPAADPGKQSAESAATTSTAATGDVLKAEQDKVLAPPAPKGGASKDMAATGKDTKAAPAEAKKKPTERKETAADGRQYVVQIAALADAEKAQGIQKELLGKGLKAYTELVKTASGEVTRVRIGPFPSRDGAEQERSKLKALGFDGNVVPR